MAKTIARVQIEGVIQKENETYNQKWLLETLNKLGEDKNTAAIVLYIDSPGGSVYESDEVYIAVKKLKEEHKKPVYAYCASLTASGGYYIACSADRIVANRNSLLGSVGVIAGRFVDLSKLMEKYGVKSETIHAGRNKTMGSISEPVTEEQRAIMQSIADECYEQFVNLVAENRKLDLEKVKELADGRIYTANQGKNNGLVDDIATFDEMIELLKEKEFGDKEYKAEVRKYEMKKKKSLMKMLKGTYSSITGLVKSTVPFPAYYYDGCMR